MPSDDRIWALAASYVYFTIKMAAEVTGIKPDTVEKRLQRLFLAGYLDREQESDFSPYVYFFTQRGSELACSRGLMDEPRWIQKKSKMTLAHDCEISTFHMKLALALGPEHEILWEQWRGDLSRQHDDQWIPDASFSIDGENYLLEIVKSSESGYKNGESSLVAKLKTYHQQRHNVLVVMPTQFRVEKFLYKIEPTIVSSRLWFTHEAEYQKDILGKIWWTPKNFRERQYSLLKPTND